MVRPRAERRPLRSTDWVRALALLIWPAIAGRLARGYYERLPRLNATPGQAGMAESLPVSVIVPARNEAANLPALLASLANQLPGPAEVIVVDDRSDDETSAIAANAGTRLVRGAGPPPGWTGKNFACHLGVETATQPWLLFLDADITLAPNAIATALGYAEQQDLDALSLFLQQRCQTFWERLLLPYAYAHYFAGARPGTPLANGQFILISARAYSRCGGHAAIRDSIIDDVALAHACRRAGIRLMMARGEQLGAVRMYTSLGGIWEGFSKNSFRFVLADPLGGLRTVTAQLATAASMSLIAAAVRRGGRLRWAAALAAYLLALRNLLYWQRLFHAGRLLAALHPLASGAFGAIALNSMGRVLLRRGVVWKGRRY